ncbi:MAG: Mut7-C RNAse domain-containing protein [Thermoplasmata archaeon]|nr:Mut7-C RNAse domain-containing protein [Thermoplasmata archaeon]MCI4332770.1 Mut7-C RNAse domain-containing protein [Thermoplasmata archaeon]
MAPDDVGSDSGTPRWLADAMLGKLARYLRFLGHDTAYVRDLPERELATLARSEGRTLLTRDRSLAGRAPSSLLLHESDLPGQLREVARAFPHVPFEVKFDRCPDCNIPLRPWAKPTKDSDWPTEIPRPLIDSGVPVHECPSCARRYWEGSHAARIREVVAAAIGGDGLR